MPYEGTHLEVKPISLREIQRFVLPTDPGPKTAFDIIREHVEARESKRTQEERRATKTPRVLDSMHYLLDETTLRRAEGSRPGACARIASLEAELGITQGVIQPYIFASACSSSASSSSKSTSSSSSSSSARRSHSFCSSQGPGEQAHARARESSRSAASAKPWKNYFLPQSRK